VDKKLNIQSKMIPRTYKIHKKTHRTLSCHSQIPTFKNIALKISPNYKNLSMSRRCANSWAKKMLNDV
jgi:nitrate reductase cytochrome c-type subunit